MDQHHFKEAVEFGSVLLATQDLDPVYTAMSVLSRKEKPRALLAYSCLYHLGSAGYLAGFAGAQFWNLLALAAENKDRDWPRGTERRHWRGKAAIDAVTWFRESFELPEQAVYRWINGAEPDYEGTPRYPSFQNVSVEVRKAPSFGPWIAFKVADMLDRVLGLQVDFSRCELGIYRDPAYGAALLLRGNEEKPANPEELKTVIAALLKSRLGKMKAPPALDRFINVQEVETILCKYKSHVHGHYPPGKDTIEVYHGLADPRWGTNAAKMRRKLLPYFNQWTAKTKESK